jgi:hypothetical protein
MPVKERPSFYWKETPFAVQGGIFEGIIQDRARLKNH